MNQVNQLILYVSRTIPFRSGLDGYLIRGALVFTFFAFSIQKWSQYTAEMLVPLISHSPVVFWLLPASGAQATPSGRPKRSSALSFSLAIRAQGLAILGALGSISLPSSVPRALFLSYLMAGPTKPVDFRS